MRGTGFPTGLERYYFASPSADSDQVRKLLEQDFLFFQTTTQLSLMARPARQLLEPLGKAVAAPIEEALY
jgi:hypothetical protein